MASPVRCDCGTFVEPMTRVALYGRTYLDAEVSVPDATLAERKGKADVAVSALFGGFACNAARALAGRLPRGSLRVVTLTSWLDWPRLRAALPDEVELDAIIDPDRSRDGWPPVSVIINPGGDCRLLRASGDDDADHWRIDRVAAGALEAPLHVVGRLPEPFVGDLLARARATGARVAWVGGSALSRAHQAGCDLICVNTAEAQRLLRSTSDSPRELATALAERAPAGSVRLVTGRGAAPAAAAVQGARGSVVVHEQPPASIAKAQMRRLKGAGDVFAANFVVDAVFDRRGAPRARLDVVGALASANKIVARYIRRGVA
jgi:sugar/nucleoside kinase (ribokinase family)